MSSDLTTRIREVLGRHAHLSRDLTTMSDSDDLYAAGMTSHASVTVMLACEDEWDVEFPQKMLTKATFSSIAAIAAAVGSLGPASAS